MDIVFYSLNLDGVQILSGRGNRHSLHSFIAIKSRIIFLLRPIFFFLNIAGAEPKLNGQKKTQMKKNKRKAIWLLDAYYSKCHISVCWPEQVVEPVSRFRDRLKREFKEKGKIF